MRRLLVLLIVVLVTVPAGARLPVAGATAPGIEGRITADSAALPGATVQAIQSGAVIASDTTDSTGRYDLDLTSAGTYDVRVVPPPGVPFTGTVASGVVVDPSIVTVLDIQLRSPLGTLTVTVRDGSGDAVAGARVSLRRAGYTVTSATANSSGVARLVTKPGSYGLRIEAPSPLAADSLLPGGTRIDTALDAVDVAAAGETLTVQIPTTTLTVTTTRQSDGTPVAGSLVTAKISSAPGPTVDLGGGLLGSARFATTPIASDATGNVTHLVLAVPGVSVTATPPSTERRLLAASATTDVPTAGGAVTVALPPAPAQPVTVRFLDAAGQPVADASVTSTLEFARTDADGYATVLAQSDVSTELRVTKYSTDPALPDAIFFRRNVSPSSPLDLVARAKVATVTVTVTRDLTTPVSGAGVSAATPTVLDPDGWAVTSSVRSTVTDGAGQTTVRLYPTTGIADFSASADGLFGFVLAAVPEGASSVTIDLTPPEEPGTGTNVPVTGRVVTSGNVPIAGLEVRAGSTGRLLATTNPTGGFSFDYPTGPDPQTLRLGSANLDTLANRDAPLPVSLQVSIPNAFTATEPGVDLGDIVLPVDELEVRVVDQAGGGIGSIQIGSRQRESRFPVTVGDAVLEARGTSGYPTTSESPIILTELLGDATLHLLPGVHEVQLVKDFNFSGVTLPVSAFTTVAPDTDDIVQVSLTRANAALLTSLDGAPKVNDDPLTLEGPRPTLIPIVARPDGFQDGTTSTQGLLLDWVLCETDDGIGDDIAVPRETCVPDAQRSITLFDEEDCDVRDCARLPEFSEYPVTVRVAIRSSVRNDVTFLRDGWRAFEVTILPPVDRPPRIAVGDEIVVGPEGSVATVRATATDDTDGVEVSWDLDLDGIGDVAGETLLFDLPDGPDEGAIVAIATDSSGQSTSTPVFWGSSNVAPGGVLQVTGPDAAGMVSVAVVDITDPSAEDLAAGVDVTLDLDRDSAGVFETVGPTGTIATTGLADGSYAVRARLVDRDRGERILTGSFRVGAPPPNTAPTVSAGGPYTVGEGATVLLDASADDPDGDPVTITWTVPGQGTALADPVTFDAGSLDGPTTVDVTVTACDTPQSGEPECTPEIVTVSVTNVAPGLTVGAVSGTAGTAVTLPITVSDPAAADVLTVSVDWGDGTTPEEITPFSGAPVTHTYAADGLYTVSVVASDDDGGTTPATATATITAPPSPPPPPPPPPPPAAVDLQLTVEGGEEPLRPGDRFTYRSTVRNTSTGVDATGVTVTVVLDPRLGLTTATTLAGSAFALTDPWSCFGTSTITCALAGPLTAGSEVALELPVAISSAASGQLTTTFAVSAESQLTNPPFVERIVTVADPSPPAPVAPVVPVTPAVPAQDRPPEPPSTPVNTTLPETGADVGSWLSAAIGLILLGWFSQRLARRPRRNT